MMRGPLTGLALAVMILSCDTLGQTARSQAAKVQTAAPADLTGVWSRTHHPPDNTHKYTLDQVIMSLGKDVPPMTPWGEAGFKATKPNRGPRAVPLEQTNDPVPICFPPGVPRIYSAGLGLPFEIMQIPGRVVMVFEYDHFVRQIYTDGRQHPPNLNPTWMGDSIGSWKGDTLTVDTIGFNDKTWLDALGHTHSEDMHLVERIRRVSHDTITDDITIDDPKTYTKPWVAQIVFDLRPDWKIEEDVCEDAVNFNNVQKVSESTK
jgi:hypothetical protein